MKNRSAEIFYNPIDGSAPLSIYWRKGPKGDAVEANNGCGVGFFSPSGELLGVIFDDVSEKNDHQHLEFKNYQIEIKVSNSKVKFSIKSLRSPSKSKRVSKKKKSRAA